MAFWWHFGGILVAFWWQFGGSLVAVLGSPFTCNCKPQNWHQTATKLPPNCHQTSTKLPPNFHQNDFKMTSILQKMVPQVQKNHGIIHEHIIKTKSTIYVKGTFHGPIKKKHFKWIPKPAMFFDDMFEFF